MKEQNEAEVEPNNKSKDSYSNLTALREAHTTFLLAIGMFLEENFSQENKTDKIISRNKKRIRSALLSIAKQIQLLALNIFKNDGESGDEYKEAGRLMNRLKKLLDDYIKIHPDEVHLSSLEKDKQMFDLSDFIIDFGREINLISNEYEAKIAVNSGWVLFNKNIFSEAFVNGVNSAKKGSAKKGASIVNTQHKDRQDFVFKWLDANYKDGDTHEDLASRLEPLLDGERKYGTILKDISTWKKER